VVQVAAACGVNLTAEDIERTENMSFNLQPGMTSSMHKDLLNGKRLEIDALNGAIIRLGHAKGIPTPVHQTIFACLKPYANGN
jgi:2-dehydropantoate 2-reductase